MTVDAQWTPTMNVSFVERNGNAINRRLGRVPTKWRIDLTQPLDYTNMISALLSDRHFRKLVNEVAETRAAKRIELQLHERTIDIVCVDVASAMFIRGFTINEDITLSWKNVPSRIKKHILKYRRTSRKMEW
jgi:hypothetical protein